MALPEPVRRRLSNFSRTVFSDSNRTGPEYPDGGCSPDNEIVSSLPLQMSLYFNLYFFPFWWVSSVVMLQLKYSVLPDYYKFILVTIIILASLIEAIRLYLGYIGNLQEKVPELAGFWLLSLLLQFPLILFLLFNEGLKIQPLERAVHIIFAFFLTFQDLRAFEKYALLDKGLGATQGIKGPVLHAFGSVYTCVNGDPESRLPHLDGNKSFIWEDVT
ncbi:transmembrane protein 17 isoform B [Alligator mississippiensis]|uniref:Transmembrane protein 17 isoform B n=1 Tax=Alligator mississippiensis TaxID=8496 RepID=A0A151MGK6_ALLMI|nr:transmembrane protein 17 isoform B [Alligator mississippiensis]